MKTQAAQKHDNCYVVACPPVYGAARRRTLCAWPIIRQCSRQSIVVVKSRRDTMPGEHKTILFVECHFCPRLFDMFGRARENIAFLVQT